MYPYQGRLPQPNLGQSGASSRQPPPPGVSNAPSFAHVAGMNRPPSTNAPYGSISQYSQPNQIRPPPPPPPSQLAKPTANSRYPHPFLETSSFFRTMFPAWPKDLQQYTLRALEQVKAADPMHPTTDEKFAFCAIEGKIDALLRRAVRDNNLFQIQWAALPLPWHAGMNVEKAKSLPNLTDNDRLLYMLGALRTTFTMNQLREENVMRAAAEKLAEKQAIEAVQTQAPQPNASASSSSSVSGPTAAQAGSLVRKVAVSHKPSPLPATTVILDDSVARPPSPKRRKTESQTNVKKKASEAAASAMASSPTAASDAGPVPTSNDNVTTTISKSSAKAAAKAVAALGFKDLADAEKITERGARFSSGHMIGRSNELERAYLRAPPQPELIRPEEVLKKALLLVLSKYKTKPASERYIYAFEQLKSIRQDLTIQGIRNPFALHVYEIHARIALERENGDLGEYVQCQNVLQDMYAEGHVSKHRAEFNSYYALHLAYADNNAELCELLRFVQSFSLPSMKNSKNKFDVTSPHWLYAMSVVQFMYQNLYVRAVKVIGEHIASGAGTALDDALMLKCRVQVWHALLKALRGTAEVAYITDALAFPAVSDCREWLLARGIAIAESGVPLESALQAESQYQLAQQQKQ